MSKNVLDTSLIDLLWTNPSPTASFAAQTKSIDLSKYDFVLIESVFDTRTNQSKNSMVWSIGKVGEYMAQINPSDECIVRRINQVTTTGIAFGGASLFLSYNNATTTTNNAYAIPQKIYGIKSSLGGGLTS